MKVVPLPACVPQDREIVDGDDELRVVITVAAIQWIVYSHVQTPKLTISCSQELIKQLQYLYTALRKSPSYY